MAATEIKVQMQQRRDTAAGWISAGTVLLAGELGYETDTGYAKLGDGSTAWESLDYLPAAGKAKDGTASAPGISFKDDGDVGFFRPSSNELGISTGGSERIRVDNAGRLLVGTTSEAHSGTIAQIQHVGSPVLSFARNDTSISDGNGLGQIDFYGNDGGTFQECAKIIVQADGTHANDDKPSRMVFYTTAGSASSSTERLRIDSSGRVGIGTTAPADELHINSTANVNLRLTRDTDTGARISGTDGTSPAFIVETIASGTASERLRVDSSGRLLVGTTSARANFLNGSVTGLSQVEGSGSGTSRGTFSLINNATTEHPATLLLGRSNDNAVGSNALSSNGDWCGRLGFMGNDGSEFVELASISGLVDGTAAANDMPGRLSFRTTASGESSPSERLRIDSSGRVGIGTTAPGAPLVVRGGSASNPTIRIEGSGGTDNARIESEYNLVLACNADGDQSNRSIQFRNDDALLTSIDSSGQLIIMGASASTTNSLDLSYDSTSGVAQINADSNGGSTALAFGTSNSGSLGERMRLDNRGSLLIGASSSVDVGSASHAELQVETDQNICGAFYSTVNAAGPGGILCLGHARGSATGVLQDNDVLGEVRFAGGDGTDLETQGAKIKSEVDGTPGSNDMPSRLIFETCADDANSTTERLRIDSSGHIRHTGLRSGNGENKLANYTVPSHDTSEEDVAVFSVANESSSNEITFGGGGSAYNAATAIIFRTASAVDTTVGTERMRIASNGAINAFYAADGALNLRTAGTNSADSAFRLFKGATSNSDGTACMAIRQDGDLENTNNSYGALSDVKLKENIVDASSQWSDLKALQVRKYNFKAETGHSTHTQIGLVAQEVETVSPGLVAESPDRDEEGNDLGTVTKSVNYSVLYMKAVKALQEAMDRIETLENKVAALEAQ